jgi:hypothetical protein
VNLSLHLIREFRPNIYISFNEQRERNNLQYKHPISASKRWPIDEFSFQKLLVNVSLKNKIIVINRNTKTKLLYKQQQKQQQQQQ